MNQYEVDSKGFTALIAVTHEQRTNNLDGILRDFQNNPIFLNPSDYRHQAYFGPDRRSKASKEFHGRYIFKDGELIKVDENRNLCALSICFTPIA